MIILFWAAFGSCVIILFLAAFGSCVIKLFLAAFGSCVIIRFGYFWELCDNFFWLLSGVL